jgi:hypothetical protein
VRKKTQKRKKMAQEITHVCDWCGTKEREDQYPEPADWVVLTPSIAKKSTREKGQRAGRVDMQVFPVEPPYGFVSLLVCPKCLESIQTTLRKLYEAARRKE